MIEKESVVIKGEQAMDWTALYVDGRSLPVSTSIHNTMFVIFNKRKLRRRIQITKKGVGSQYLNWRRIVHAQYLIIETLTYHQFHNFHLEQAIGKMSRQVNNTEPTNHCHDINSIRVVEKDQDV